MKNNVNNMSNILMNKYSRMPYGVIKKVAETCGVSRALVGQVKRGKIRNTKVLETLINELESFKMEEEAINQRLQNL